MIAFEEVPPEEVVHYGIAKPRRRRATLFELDDLVEKPSVAEAPSNLAVAARYVFSPAIFDYLEQTPPGKGDEIQLTDAIRMLIRDGRKVLGVRLPAGRAAVRHRQLRELLPGLRRVRPGRSRLRSGAARVPGPVAGGPATVDSDS